MEHAHTSGTRARATLGGLLHREWLAFAALAYCIRVILRGWWRRASRRA